jgi:hypothetical protein
MEGRFLIIFKIERGKMAFVMDVLGKNKLMG